jgi:hypothetical protein
MPGSTPTVDTRDVACPDAQPVGIVENGERGVHRLPVHERLAHAHEHDVRHRHGRVEQPHLAHLPGNLVHGQIAREAHGAGGAEGAAQRAARLRRDAQRHPVAVGDGHRLDGLAVAQPEEEFLGAVRRLLARGDAEPGQGEVLGEQRAERRRQVAHVREAGGRRHPQVPHDLPGAVGRQPLLAHERRQALERLGRGEVEQVFRYTHGNTDVSMN